MKIIVWTLVMMSRVILVGLIFWGFMLYTRNEWAMWY
jgi:hypothetical protein